MLDAGRHGGMMGNGPADEITDLDFQQILTMQLVQLVQLVNRAEKHPGSVGLQRLAYGHHHLGSRAGTILIVASVEPSRCHFMPIE